MSDQENHALRKLLWLRHGCPITALYGDDGEMSCSACRLDFKRQPVEEIEARWRQQAIASLAGDLHQRKAEEKP
jgi:hypothetical protein